MTGVSVSVLNLRGESMASGAITATQPGLRVRLMRGTYTVRVTASGTDDELGRRFVLPEEAKLELLTDPDMYIACENALRGGVCVSR